MFYILYCTSDGGSVPSLQLKVPSTHSPPVPGTHVAAQQSPPSKLQTWMPKNKHGRCNRLNELIQLHATTNEQYALYVRAREQGDGVVLEDLVVK